MIRFRGDNLNSHRVLNATEVTTRFYDPIVRRICWLITMLVAILAQRIRADSIEFGFMVVIWWPMGFRHFCIWKINELKTFESIHAIQTFLWIFTISCVALNQTCCWWSHSFNILQIATSFNYFTDCRILGQLRIYRICRTFRTNWSINSKIIVGCVITWEFLQSNWFEFQNLRTIIKIMEYES